MENAEDLHGSARWADEDDIRDTGLITAKHGVYVGGWCREGGRHRCITSATTDPSTFSLSRQRAPAKAWVWSFPRSWLGQNPPSSTTSKVRTGRRRQGSAANRAISVSSFRRSKSRRSSRFNPLAEVRLFTPRDVSDAQNIANMIVRTGEDSPQERYWQDAAASITTGMILHVCYEAALEGRVACLADLAHVFTRPGSGFRETLDELLNFEHDPGHAHDWRMPTGDRTPTHPVVREKVQEMLDKEDRDFGGVLSTAKTALTLYSDPLVAKNTSASDFTIDDLVNYRTPDLALPGRSAFGQDPPAPAHPADVHDGGQSAHRKDGLPGRRAEAEQASPVAC